MNKKLLEKVNTILEQLGFAYVYRIEGNTIKVVILADFDQINTEVKTS